MEVCILGSDPFAVAIDQAGTGRSARVAIAADRPKTSKAVMMKGLAPTKAANLHIIGVSAIKRTELFINCVSTTQATVSRMYIAMGLLPAKTGFKATITVWVI